VSDWSMNSILEKLRSLGPGWHEKLADEMTAEERVRVVEAIEIRLDPIEPFTLIVIDRDEKTFSVEGLMIDDDPWTDAVIEAQNCGRQVNCHVPGGAARSSVKVAAHVYAQEYSEVRQVPAGSIVRPSPA